MSLVVSQYIAALLDAKVQIKAVPNTVESTIFTLPTVEFGGPNSNVYYKRLFAVVNPASSYTFDLVAAEHKVYAILLRASRPVAITFTLDNTIYRTPLATYWMSVNSAGETENIINPTVITVNVPAAPAAAPPIVLEGVYPKANVELLVVASS